MARLKPFWLILQQTRSGCISRNFCCNTIQFEFGNVMLSFIPEAFLRFVSFVEEIDQTVFEPRRPGCARKLAVELHPSIIVMTLSKAEAEELRELVCGARNVIELTGRGHRPQYCNN